MDQKINQQDYNQFTVVLLAAGFGSRISELTEDPKSLLKINDISLLERNLKIWKELGIKRLRIVLGYKEEKIREVLKNYENEFQITYYLNEDYKRKGNTYSLYLGLKDWYPELGASLIFDADLIYSKVILNDFLKNTCNSSSILTGEGAIDDIECAKVLVEKDDDGNQWVRKTVDKRAISSEELVQYFFVGEALGILTFSENDTKLLANKAEMFLSNKENIGLNWEHLLNEFFPSHEVSYWLTQSKQWVEIDTPADYQTAVDLFINDRD